MKGLVMLIFFFVAVALIVLVIHAALVGYQQDHPTYIYFEDEPTPTPEKLIMTRPKERICLKQAEYRKNNPEKIRAINHRQRAKRGKAGGNFTFSQISLQDQRQKNRCYYCHKKMGNQRTIEHIIPLSRGGSNDISNIVLACRYCNISKNAKLPHEWPQGGRLL
jgi:5-methylcytosine-specific restriction endonuclease McrA